MEMVEQTGSLYMARIWREIIELTFEVKKAFLGTLVILLLVHNSVGTWHREASAR